MVGFAFIFVAALILGPLLVIVMLMDYLEITRSNARARRGFEVIQPTDKR
jgi:hypothetical protein